MRPLYTIALALLVAACQSAPRDEGEPSPGGVPAASATLGMPADSLYASVRARLEKRGHRIDQADPERRTLVVRPPGDDTRITVLIGTDGDSSTISFMPHGNANMMAGLRAMITVTHDATMEDAKPAAQPGATGVPGSRWRPELFVSPAGRLWIARAGLYHADSLRGPWELVLGQAGDPVDADALHIDVSLAFVGEDSLVLGLPQSFEEQSVFIYRTADRGESWTPVPTPGIAEIDAMEAIGPSVWAFGARWEGEEQRVTFLRSTDGGLTWERPGVPEKMADVTGLYRVSPSVAYVSTMKTREDPQRPVFWRTTDGGASWTPIPTPHDQGLHTVPRHGVRIEEIAPVGQWLVVREYGKVFVSPVDNITWRPRDDLDHVVTDRHRDALFALTKEMQAALLDRDLKFLWRTADRVPDTRDAYVDKIVAHDGIGYVSMGHGQVYEARDGKLTLVPAQEQ